MAQEAESTTNVAWQKAWQGRARGLWACSAVGLAFGAAIGVIAPFFPAIVGATTLAAAAALVGKSILIFGAAGIAAGFVAGQSVGVSAGAASGVAKEQEQRDLDRAAANGQSTEVEKTRPSANEEAVKPPESLSDLIKPKSMAFFALLGALGGAVMGAAAFYLGGGAPIPGATMMLGEAAGQLGAILAYSSGVVGCFGALFGTNMPKFTTMAQDFMGKALSGELFEDKAPQQAPALEPQKQVEVAPMPHEPSPQPTLAPAGNRITSYRDFVKKDPQPTAAFASR